MVTAQVRLSAVAQAALRCAAKGWPVLPLRGKLPHTRHGLKDAVTDPAQVRDWWRQWPDANLGICTGTEAGVWVLDIDTHGEHNGYASLDELEAEHGALPDTLAVLTGSGGLHLYWTMPEGRRLRNRTSVRPGLDVRGSGGYVVAPPSVHPDTRQPYEVKARHPVAEAPAWLVDLVAPVQPRKRPPPPCPTGVRLPPGRYQAEARRRLKEDPGTRERLGLALGGRVAGQGDNATIKGVRCPQCGRPSVWWPLMPQHGGFAKCNHANSCGWWGPLDTFTSGG